MSRHEDGQNGGRSHDAIQWDFQGDIFEARKFTGIGRQVLGELKRYIQLSGIRTHTWRKTLRNGVVIVAMSIIAEDGMADIDKVLIVAPPVGGGREKLIGFVVNLEKMIGEYREPIGNSLVAPILRVQTVADWNTTNTRIELLSLNSDIISHEPFGRDLQQCRVGIIEGTYDDTPAILDKSSLVDEFYYWDATRSGSVSYGPAQVIGQSVKPPDDPHVSLPYSNFTGVGSISPVNSRHTPDKAVGLYCKASAVTLGEIKTEDTNDDGFVAVVKKPIEVSFDDASWDATKTKFTASFNTYARLTVFANGDLEGTNIHNFPGSPFATNMETIATFTNQQAVTPHNFTFETDVEDEDWRITGEGDVTLFLISNKQVYKVSHTFPIFQFWNNSKKAQSVIEVKLGKEFEKIEEAYEITDKIIY